jgi:hypothetical protein
MKKLILLVLLPLMSYAQGFENIYYSPSITISIMDDSYAEPIQDAKILASKNNLYPLFGKGKVMSSFESNSDMDALYDYQWKSDYITRPGEQKQDALVKGDNGKYYIIRWQ